MFNEILQSIATVGFPIVMCLVLAWYVKEQNNTHREETSDFVKAINKNTIVIQKLCDKLNITMEISENEND